MTTSVTTQNPASITKRDFEAWSAERLSGSAYSDWVIRTSCDDTMVPLLLTETRTLWS